MHILSFLLVCKLCWSFGNNIAHSSHALNTLVFVWRIPTVCWSPVFLWIRLTWWTWARTLTGITPTSASTRTTGPSSSLSFPWWGVRQSMSPMVLPHPSFLTMGRPSFCILLMGRSLLRRLSDSACRSGRVGLWLSVQEWVLVFIVCWASVGCTMTQAYTCTPTYAFIHTHTCIHMHTLPPTHLSIHTHTHSCIHPCMCACMHTRTHTQHRHNSFIFTN